MREVLHIISPFSIIVPVVVGCIRFKLIQTNYKPFVYLLWTGLVCEILEYFVSSYARTNIYSLIEFTFYLWFFKNVLKSVKQIWLKILFILGLALWLFENILLAKLFTAYDFYFELGYSLALTLLAVEGINEVLLKEKRSLLQNGLFLITAGMVVYFMFNIFTEVEMHFAGVGNKMFFRAIFAIQQWINCLINLLFAFAILWIPTKKNFTNPSF